MRSLLLSILIASTLTAQTGPARRGGAVASPFTYPTQVGSAYSNDCGTASSCTSSSFTSTANDFFVVGCDYANLGINPMSVTDSHSNTLTSLPQISFSVGANGAVQFFYILGESAGSVSFTCGFTNSVPNASILVIQFHPGSISSLDAANTVANTNVLSTNLTPTSAHFSPSAQEFVLMGAYATGPPGTISDYGIGTYTTTQDSTFTWYYADATTASSNIYGFLTCTNAVAWGMQILTFH